MHYVIQNLELKTFVYFLYIFSHDLVDCRPVSTKFLNAAVTISPSYDLQVSVTFPNNQNLELKGFGYLLCDTPHILGHSGQVSPNYPSVPKALELV